MAHQQQQQQLAQSVNCSLDDIDLTSLKVCFKLQEQQPQQHKNNNINCICRHLMNCCWQGVAKCAWLLLFFNPFPHHCLSLSSNERLNDSLSASLYFYLHLSLCLSAPFTFDSINRRTPKIAADIVVCSCCYKSDKNFCISQCLSVGIMKQYTTLQVRYAGVSLNWFVHTLYIFFKSNWKSKSLRACKQSSDIWIHRFITIYTTITLYATLQLLLLLLLLPHRRTTQHANCCKTLNMSMHVYGNRTAHCKNCT